MEKINVARSSLVAAIGLTAFKFAVGLSTGSLGIISEAVHSSLDLLAALMTLLAVRVSDKPADADHHFGHGKYENLSALFETVLLMLTCVWIVYEAVHRLLTGELAIEVNAWSFIVIVVAIVIDFSRGRALSKAAKKYRSQALEADALHFTSDIYSSLVVLAGLICYTFGIRTADSLSSIAVSCIVLVVGWRLGRRSIDVLTDRTPRGAREAVLRVVGSMPEVLGSHDVRIRMSGGDVIIDLNIHARADASLHEAHQLSEEVERRIAEAIPHSLVHVHMEPDAHELPPSAL
jgi:cation diffusion facilitator family transporter